MKLYTLLLAVCLFTFSCSSDDDNSKKEQEIELNTQINFTLSGDSMDTIILDPINIELAQQCAILELFASGFQNESLDISIFQVYFGDAQYYLTSGGEEVYNHDDNPFIEDVGAFIVIDSIQYALTSMTFAITKESFQDSVCSDFHGSIFDIDFTMVLEGTSGNCEIITITGNISELPIITFACAC